MLANVRAVGNGTVFLWTQRHRFVFGSELLCSKKQQNKPPELLSPNPGSGVLKGPGRDCEAPPPPSHGDADWFVWLRARTETKTWSEEQPGQSGQTPVFMSSVSVSSQVRNRVCKF